MKIISIILNVAEIVILIAAIIVFFSTEDTLRSEKVYQIVVQPYQGDLRRLFLRTRIIHDKAEL